MTPLQVAVMTALLGFRLALAQDPVSVRPAMVKVDFENEQIRVLHLRYAPHEKLPMHSHPGRVVVLLTELHIRSMLPDGTSREARRPAGDIFGLTELLTTRRICQMRRSRVSRSR